jgi:hypothetical protein
LKVTFRGAESSASRTLQLRFKQPKARRANAAAGRGRK